MMENWLTSDPVSHRLQSTRRKCRLTILSWEQRLSLEHLCKDTSRAPDIDGNIVFLPRQHDLWRTVVSRRDVTSHLGVLDSGQTEIANLDPLARTTREG